MKVLLINPPSSDGKVWVREGRCQQVDIWGAPFPPLTLAHLKTLLKDVSRVLLMDPAASRVPLERLWSQVVEFDPDVAIMTVTTPTIKNDCEWFANALKKRLPKVVVGAAGIHVIALPTETLEKFQSLDFVINTEPEAAVYEMAQAMAGNKDWLAVPGVTYKDAKRAIRQEPYNRALPELDSYGLPDWTDLDLSHYRLPIKNRPFLLISFSKGCPYSCSFCAAHAYYGKKVRKRSIASIIQEIRNDLSLGITDFLFWAEAIGQDRDYVTAFLDALKETGLDKRIRWVCNSRVDQLDYETLVALKQAGCWQLALGLEFGTDRALQLANKGGTATIAKGKEIVTMANRLGLVVDGHFILGFPGETQDDMAATIRFAKSLPLTFAHFYAATPFPGSQLYEDLKSRYKLGSAWEDISQDTFVLDTKEVPQDLVYRLLSKAYRTFYLSFYRIWKVFAVAKSMSERLLLCRTGCAFAINLLKPS